MKAVSTLLTGALVVGGLIAVTTPSQAAFTTHCVGVAGAVTVPGDVVVPAGQSCSLDGTVIQGNVRVQTGADLLITDGTIEGNLVAQADSYVDASGTTVAANVVSRGTYGVFLTESAVAGNVNSPVIAGRGGFLLTDRTGIGGSITDRSGTTLLVSSTVGKQVTGNGNIATDLEDTVINGRLTVSGTDQGSLLCDSEVHGNATYLDNADALQIGGTAPWASCTGSAYFGGDLSIDSTTGGVHLVDAIVRGDLSGEGNTPSPVGSGNRVRGEVSGQFADLGSPTGAQFGAKAQGEDRVSQARSAAKARTQTAEVEAIQAGPANL